MSKTIIENATKLSKYVFEDDVSLVMEVEYIGTPNFIISDLNFKNSTVIDNVTVPEDWVGCKYTYDNDIWTLDPLWEESTEEI